MDTIELQQSVRTALTGPVAATMQAAKIGADRDASRDELARILEAEGMTNVLDMLASLAEERSQLEGDKWERIGRKVQNCANDVEHMPDDGD